MSTLNELRIQLRTSFPATISNLLYKIPWLISLSFVGAIGSKELAAASLATTLCNVMGMSLSVGLSSAITTLAGQARGELIARAEVARHQRRRDEAWASTKKLVVDDEGDESSPLKSYQHDETLHRGSLVHNSGGVKDADANEEDTSPILPLVYLMRGIFIQTAFLLPVGCYWLHGMKPLLKYFGQGEELSTMTEQYLKILTPGLWAFSVNRTLTTWLQVMELAHIPVYAALFGGLLHVPNNLFFIHVVGLGWLGVGVATVMFQVLQPVAMILYLFQTSHGRQQLLQHISASGVGGNSLSFWCETKVAISSINGIYQYLALALPGVLAISEWWASEICTFLAGKLGPSAEIALGSMAIYQSLNLFFFTLPVGMSISGSARVGAHLGSGNSNEAQLSAKICFAGASVLSAVVGFVLYFTPHTLFPSLFTSDAVLIQMTSQIVPLLSIYVVGDGMVVALTAIINSCGRQIITVPVVIFAYWVVAIPSAWYFAFVRSGGTTDCDNLTLCGIAGLVSGLTVGTWVHFFLLASYTVCVTDWYLEAKLARERLTLDKTPKNASMVHCTGDV